MLLIGLSASRAHACLGSHDETQTFLTAVPIMAAFESYVGSVEIIDVNVGKKDHVRITRVKTIKTHKGQHPGETFLVRSGITSCTRDYVIEVGQIYFVAGQFENDVFSSIWRGLPRDEYWTRDSPEASE